MRGCCDPRSIGRRLNARLDAVEGQVKDTVAREELRRALEGILDLERLLSRVTLETANPRDVLALAASLGHIPAGARGGSTFLRRGGSQLHAMRSMSWAICGRESKKRS